MYAFSHLYKAFSATREPRAFFARVCFEGLTSAFCPKIQSINVIYTIHFLSWKKDFVYFICPGCRFRSNDIVHVNIIPLRFPQHVNTTRNVIIKHYITVQYYSSIPTLHLAGKKFCHLQLLTSYRKQFQTKSQYKMQCRNSENALWIFSPNPFSQFQ